ncbi:MAG: hypothetical protein K2I90_03125 [Odoribacter sp.]|nr:hypothetical protein [Odoribacter sp.]
MLLACLSLLLATTSCNNDELEFNEPQTPKQYTKAELIEQALSRMPKTRAGASLVVMASLKKTATIRCVATADIEVQWAADTIIRIPQGSELDYTHTFSDNNPSHGIVLSGDRQAIKKLIVDDNDLISLNVSENFNLSFLSCMNNHLEKINLSYCSKLQELYISNNEFASIDIAPFSNLTTFEAEHNLLTELNISENERLDVVYLGYNQIKDIDFSKNPYLYILSVRNNPISSLRLDQNTGLMYIDASYTAITDFDLSKNRELIFILLESTPIKTLNNQPINKADFSFSRPLAELNIAYTSFDSLDISRNIHLYDLDISGTNITQLDISNSQISRLCATRSKLTNLTWGLFGFDFLYELHIENTPLEKNYTNMEYIGYALPNRNGKTPGHIYTYSPYANVLYTIVSAKNWLINQ